MLNTEKNMQDTIYSSFDGILEQMKNIKSLECNSYLKAQNLDLEKLMRTHLDGVVKAMNLSVAAYKAETALRIRKFLAAHSRTESMAALLNSIDDGSKLETPVNKHVAEQFYYLFEFINDDEKANIAKTLNGVKKAYELLCKDPTVKEFLAFFPEYTVKHGNTNWDDVFKYKITDAGVIITKYIAPVAERVAIPAQIKGRPVVEIGKEAFKNCEKMKYIDLPDSITKIGEWAFGFCGLEYINLPSGLKIIASFAFYRCNFKELNIPNSIETIGDAAFHHNNNLKNISLPDSFLDIGKSAFSDYKNLKKTILQNKSKELKEFKELKQLKTYERIIF